MDYFIDDSEIKNRAKQVQYVKEIVSLRLSETGIGGKLYYVSVPHFTSEFIKHDNNVVSITCFPPFPKSDESFEFIKYYIGKNIKNKDTKIFFDNIYEGQVISCIIGIHKIIDALNLDSKNVYFFTGGIEAQKLYNKFCVDKQIIDKINVRVLLAWERHLSHRLPDGIAEPSYTLSSKEKLFLSFNRMSRKHRVALLGLLYSRDLVDRGFYSFFTKVWGNATTRYILQALENNLSLHIYTTIKHHIESNYHKFPLRLNTVSEDENANYIKTDDNYYYDNSYFSLVTETFFFGEDNANEKPYEENSVFFSEKIFKPIICKHPFIQLNRPNALEYLRKIGYKTFHPFINENYDQIENDESRLLAIVDEVERLSKQTPEQWIEWQKNVADIVEHNYRVIKSKTIKDHIFNE